MSRSYYILGIHDRNRDKNYLLSWDLIQSRAVSKVPLSIADWITAYNINYNRTALPIYTASSILFAKDDQLTQLKELIGILNINKERIIRILSYLGVLD